MSAFSNYLEEKIVDHFLRNTAVPAPSVVYLALFTADPTEDGTGPEAAYTNYERQVASWTAIDSNGHTKNVNALAFPPNGNASEQVTITHGAIFDAAIGGNCLLKGPLASPKTLAIGDVASFAPNSLTLAID